MRAIQTGTICALVVCGLLMTSSGYASSQTAFKKSDKKSSQLEKKSLKHQQKEAAKAKKLQEKIDRLARREAEKLERAAAEKKRRAKPRTGYNISIQESLNHGLMVSTVYQIHNVQLSPEGAASAELEIRDSNDNIVRNEQCSATRELPTDIREDSYRLKCEINHKNRFRARLLILDVSPGLYSGTGRNTTQIDDVDSYPIGFGAVSLDAAQDQPEPTDCVVSDWTPFSSCFGGTQTRSRTILVEPQNGGAACPVLTETVFCL